MINRLCLCVPSDRWDTVPLVCEDFGEFILKHVFIRVYVLICVFFFNSGSAAGIVRTSVIVTGVQVCSRIFMVWFITNSIRQVNMTFNLRFHRLSSLLHGLEEVSFLFLSFVYLTFFSDLMKIQNEESVILFLVVWTVTEITRYSYYTFNLLNHLPYFIKWARWRCR